MNPDQVNGLISALASLLGAVLWPIVVVVVVLKFGPALTRKITESEVVTVRAVGMEASFQNRQAEVAAAIGAAANTKADIENGGVAIDAKGIADDVRHALPDGEAFVRLSRATVLWVDDRPDNNLHERRALAAMGLRVEVALSTDDALLRIEHGSYDLVISDMSRPGDRRAGYTLLDKMRQARIETPFLIYAGSSSESQVREALQHGALGFTSAPQELVVMVAKALQVKRS